MATSSLYKNFVIETREEALGMLQMFEDFYDKPQEKREITVNSHEATKDEIKSLVEEFNNGK